MGTSRPWRVDARETGGDPKVGAQHETAGVRLAKLKRQSGAINTWSFESGIQICISLKLGSMLGISPGEENDK